MMGSARKGTGSEAGSGGDTVNLATRRLSSPAFMELFRESMALIEETAAYLDGDGRTDSRALPHDALAAYTQESLRLSTRLMQLASWLLLRRAVLEGDMSEETARREAARIDLEGPGREGEHATPLPARLAALMRRGEALRRQIAQLDAALKASKQAPELRPNAVAGQIGKLRNAFERR